MRHNQNYDKNVRWLKNFKKNTSFPLSILSLRQINTGMQNDEIYARKGEIKIIRGTKAKEKCVNYVTIV